MATIGTVTRRPDGRYEGELRTLSIRAEIVILPIAADKASPNQPDYRVLSQGTEIGARTLYANLGRAAGQSDDNVYALIWNPQE